MKVKFANAEVEVWKLRKGVVLGCGSQYVHLESFIVYDSDCSVWVKFYSGDSGPYDSTCLDWLEPH